MLRRDAKLATSKKPAEVKRDIKKSLKAWYEMQDTQAPACCENCGASLISTINFMPRAHICHIVEKSPINGCPSVATHPLNRWFGCLDCHTIYDNQPAEVVAEMKIIPILRNRMRKVYPEIADNEKRRVPAFLIDEA